MENEEIKELQEQKALLDDYVYRAIPTLTLLWRYFNDVSEAPDYPSISNYNCAHVRFNVEGTDKEGIGVLTEDVCIPKDVAFAIEATLRELYFGARKIYFEEG